MGFTRLYPGDWNFFVTGRLFQRTKRYRITLWRENGMHVSDDRIARLRKFMAENGIDCFLIPSTDFHSSEYVGDFFKVTEYFSGCTSDNVDLVIGMETAELWTDGRYFISAAAELAGSAIHLMRSGTPGVPTVEAYLAESLCSGMVLAFDGRCMNLTKGRRYERLAEKVGASVRFDLDPAREVWTDRPALPSHPVYTISEDLAGKTAEEKIREIRSAFSKKGCDWLFLSKLDDICWTLNMRGDDIQCNPVALCHALIGKESFHLFIQSSETDAGFRSYAEKIGVTLCEYSEVFGFLEKASVKGKILVDPKHISVRVADILKEKAELVCAANPTELMKAVKNPVEMQNIYQTYLLDSVELCRFLFRFSEKIGKETMTEMTAAGELDALRAQIPGFIGLSFPTISAYGSNAAMAHYSATEDNCAEIRPEGFYLVDSGGQYLGGTTDVTRTIVCGPLTDRQKRDFTLVVIANLNLLNARFLHGTTGILLDACARMPLWEHAVNYDHGTGHGIGYILNVHEGPQSIRWKSVPGQADAVFEAGMIVSDEPGIYIENEYGIRTETILMTVPYTENEYGRFLRFEPLTWVPIDLRGIDPSVMQPRDIERLDAYHAGVYEKISPFFSGAELAWLRKVTLPYREYCSC